MRLSTGMAALVIAMSVAGCTSQSSPTSNTDTTPISANKSTITVTPILTQPATNTPTATTLAVYDPTPFGCPDGSILFDTYDTNSTTQLGTYAVCPDGSRLQEVQIDPLTFADNLSPDRKMRVWVTESGDGIKITDITGFQVIKLLHDDTEEGRIHEPSWSPDEEYVAYLKETISPKGIYYARLDMMHIDTGTASHDIAVDDPYVDTTPGWQWISGSSSTNEILLYDSQKPLEIASISCDNMTHFCTAHVRPVGIQVTRSYPFRAWSPDSLQLAYACYTVDRPDSSLFHQGLCVQDTKGNAFKEFKEADMGVEDIDFLAWSPDGTRIAFSAYPVGEHIRRIFVLSLEDGSLRTLTSALPGNQEEPIWIP